MNLKQTMSKMLGRNLSTDEARKLADEQFGMLATHLREEYAPKFLAVVPTDYEIYAIGRTEHEAKQKALKAAKEWLDRRDVKYKSLKELEEWLGCNVYPLSTLGVGQEG